MPQRRRYHHSRRGDAGIQVASVRARFPGFSCHRIGPNRYVFNGSIQPTEKSPIYHIRITFMLGYEPAAFVVAPTLHEDAPHLWEDGSLCLYHPNKFVWREDHLVADYTIPWVALWLYFYEQWLDLGVWLGPEAPH